jgi:hypothetical protein
MQDDDEATVGTLEAYRTVFRDKIKLITAVSDMAGDSVLAVFEAATEAVRTAFRSSVCSQSGTRRCPGTPYALSSVSISARSSKDRMGPSTATA